jgi:hypothetical protein
VGCEPGASRFHTKTTLCSTWLQSPECTACWASGGTWFPDSSAGAVGSCNAARPRRSRPSGCSRNLRVTSPAVSVLLFKIVSHDVRLLKWIGHIRDKMLPKQNTCNIADVNIEVESKD